jgi:hypothetical protein
MGTGKIRSESGKANIAVGLRFIRRAAPHHTALAEQGVEGDQKIHVRELHAEHSWLIWIDSDAALAANPRCRSKLARDER